MIIFFLCFLLYLYTLFPWVAQYRDSGEMVTAASTLGIAHPPGYPLYVVLSKAFLNLMPFGNAAYKLNVLSALAGAAAAGMLYALFKHRYKDSGGAGLIAAGIALLFGTSYLQWYLSLVSEMYTWNTLFAAVLLFLALRGSSEPTEKFRGIFYLLFCFLFGLGLGNRMDLLLLGAGLSLLLMTRTRRFPVPHALLLFLLGFSVFLYLPLRSGQFPALDWNHPATAAQFWATLTRKTHGGTLDLVSAPYASGANFLPTILFYGNHLLRGFGIIGPLFGILGFCALWRRRKDVALATLSGWLLSGPVFIYLSNMPPNPHALAILEAHFLMPNIIIVFWIGEGVMFLDASLRKVSWLRTIPAAALVVLAMTAVNLRANLPELNKRKNLVLYDYSKNIFRSLPPGSVVVAKKDVQLFSLWARQMVWNERPDLTVISQGLAASAWYENGLAGTHPGVFVGPLRNARDWGELVRRNSPRPVYFSGDSEFFVPDGMTTVPSGLVSALALRTGASAPGNDTLLRHVYPIRGTFCYQKYREFFTPDLIEDYAQARLRLGESLITQKRYRESWEHLMTALRYNPLFPLAATYMAFSYFEAQLYDQSLLWYSEAAGQYRKTLRLADDYRALPESKQYYLREYSDSLVSLGVCLEKMGRAEESVAEYKKALDANPANAQARFNLAAVYWKQNDWESVVRELEQVRSTDPHFPGIERYLREARVFRTKNRKQGNR